MWSGLAIGGPLIAAVVMFAGGSMPRMDGAYGIAMQELNSCSAVTDRLGKPVEQKRWGGTWGSSDTRGGQWGNAQWSIPVAGPKASGRYSYAAELHGGGAWQILRASLKIGEDTINVVPCGDGWLAKTIESGKKSAPLYQSFGEVGTVAKASGRTSVKSGDVCEVSVTPVAGFQKNTQFNCRIIVRCGPKVIYGWENSGYMNCETDRGMPTRANDPWGTAKDTDPMIEVDLPNNRVVVSDDNPESTYTITIVWPAKGK